MSDLRDMKLDEIKAILEALIYVSEEPVKPEELSEVFPKEEGGRVREALEELLLEFAATPRGVRIIQVAGGYRMQTRPEHDPWIRSLYRMRNRVRLSRAALETLSIIAYRQPITTPEIQAMRGTNPIGVLQTLLERGLVKVLGRKKVVGKPLLYGTTDEFLVHFGLNSLSDLPSLEEFGELSPVGEGSAPEPTPAHPEVLPAPPPESPGAAVEMTPERLHWPNERTEPSPSPNPEAAGTPPAAAHSDDPE